MAKIIRTSDGDRLDTLCLRHYGVLSETVGTVLAANPGLPDIAQPYESGVIIVLPDLSVPAEKPIRLWS